MALSGAASRVNPLYLLMARDAGLDEIVGAFEQDLLIAIQSAMQLRNVLFTLDDVKAEVWPPMQARSCP
ncbi:hypothetical protein [Bordetella muralis]|jgi:hypothetical protein|uniref:hypothetical protein n=1 Tax=Bordetella muralis TaxID=1649130 RepID=UPI0039F0BC75